jgi:hypothetical protein
VVIKQVGGDQAAWRQSSLPREAGMHGHCSTGASTRCPRADALSIASIRWAEIWTDSSQDLEVRVSVNRLDQAANVTTTFEICLITTNLPDHHQLA